MKEGGSMKNKMKISLKSLFNIILPTAVIIVIALFLMTLHARRISSFEELIPTDGVLDISGLDFTDEVYLINGSWDFYPGALYFHEDFNSGQMPEKAGKNEWRSDIPYGTFRLVVKAEPFSHYSLCGFSVDYGTRLFVDGVEVFTSGVVAAGSETAVPKISYMTYPLYVGETGEAEIICQYSNFVHNEGGSIKPTYISTPQNIEEYKAGTVLVSLTISGAMLILSMYFLLCAVIQRQSTYAHLSFCCLLMALRDQLFLNDYLLLPETSWFFTYRCALAVVVLLPSAFLLMLRNMYPFEAKPITIGYVAVNMALVLLISFLNTKSLVSVVVIGYVISIPYALYVIYTIIKRFVTKARFRRADLLTFTGFAILIASLTIEALLSRSTPFITNFGLVPTCMLIFVLITAVSISIRIQEQKAALAESRSRAEMLTRMNDMNLDFFHKIAHELKTPLTIISGYAQLTALEISANKLSDETLANLKTIQTEAMRLSGMVTNLMSYSCGKNDSPVFSSVSVSDLLTRVGAISVPMCLKNNNRIVVKGKDCDDVYGNEEMLLQVFINLVINANRHTKDGTISISASDTESNEYVVFRIKDTGDGISDDILPNIFKKGHSGDGGSGLGLAICREAVELHGGTIEVESTGATGTTFKFTVLRRELKE